MEGVNPHQEVVDGGPGEVEEGGVSVGLSGTNGGVVQSRTSELTIAFEGEVYVFPAVTPEKVQFFRLSCGQQIHGVFTYFY